MSQSVNRLAGKTALITGGGNGLGAAIGRRFREAGARVLINDLDPERASKIASELGGRAFPADVSDSTAIRELFEEVARSEPQLDILVNNAGFGGAEGNPAAGELLEALYARQEQEQAAGGPITTHLDLTMNHSDADWHRMIGVHLNGTFFCSREALKIMAPRLSGCIINMGSMMGTTSMAGVAAYSAAKGGILAFTRALAREVASRNIRVNALAPGFIHTDLTEPLGPVRDRIARNTPMGRLGEPDDIAWAAVYLASDESRFMTGQVIAPNGGYYMSQ